MNGKEKEYNVCVMKKHIFWFYRVFTNALIYSTPPVFEVAETCYGVKPIFYPGQPPKIAQN